MSRLHGPRTSGSARCAPRAGVRRTRWPRPARTRGAVLSRTGRWPTWSHHLGTIYALGALARCAAA